MSYAVGTEINGYRLAEKLTTSSAGWVGFADKDHRPYHIKVLAKPSYPPAEVRGGEASKEKRRRQFETVYEDWQRKARCMQHLDPDGPIVPITDVFRAPSPGGPADLIVLVSPRVTLADIPHADLSAQEKLTFMMAAAFALATFHDLGLVHSDIKAKNVPVYRTPLGRHSAKLLDFDGSYFRDVPPKETTHDQQYVAPEVLRFENGACGSEVLGPHVDIFSLGVLFAEMWGGAWRDATGDRRYPCEVVSDGRFDAAGWMAKASEIPKPVPQLIAAMLALEMTERPSARQVHEALFHIRCGTTPASKPITEIRKGPGFESAGGPTPTDVTTAVKKGSAASKRRTIAMKKPGGGVL